MGDTRGYGEPQMSRSVWVRVMREASLLEERMAGYWQAACQWRCAYVHILGSSRGNVVFYVHTGKAKKKLIGKDQICCHHASLRQKGIGYSKASGSL